MLISIRGNNWEKVHPEQFTCQKLLQVGSIEEEKLQFCTLFCQLLSKQIFRIFLNSLEISSGKILRCLDIYIQIL
jgi:hypothetical protein